MLTAAGSEMLPAVSSSELHGVTGESALRWPKPIGSPVLESLRPVIEHSRGVRTNVDKTIEVARGLAYEELAWRGAGAPRLEKWECRYPAADKRLTNSLTKCTRVL